MRVTERTTEDLKAELERTNTAIAVCHIETGWTKDLRTYSKQIEAELYRRERVEIIVKCSLCGDMWHTYGKVGEHDACTNCDDYFMIHEDDVVTQEEYEQANKAALDPQEIEFEEAKRNESE